MARKDHMLKALTVMRQNAARARELARAFKDGPEMRHHLERAAELESAANDLEADMRGQAVDPAIETEPPMSVGQAIVAINRGCDRIVAVTGLTWSEGREFAEALKRSLFLIAEMKREQATADKGQGPARGVMVTVDQWDYRAMAWLNLDGPAQVQHLEAGRELVREARGLIWAGPRPYENAATDVVVREFLGFLSVDVPELYCVEVPRLADAWERFKAERNASARHGAPIQAKACRLSARRNPPESHHDEGSI